MNILITGGAGYVGTELTYELAKDDRVKQIIIYDNLSRENYNLFLDTKYPQGKIKFVKGELLDTRKIKKLLDNIDTVVHLAAKVSTPLGSGELHIFEQVNHWGTAELVYAIEESNVSRFIYLSSNSIYGASEEPISIDTMPNPKTFYGSTKLRGEAHVQRLFSKMPAYILRCANVFGYSPSARFDSVMNRFMFEANFVGKIKIEGNGEQHRSFIHINKVVNVLHNIIFAENFQPDIYNLVGKNLTINEVAALIQQLYPALEMIYVNQHIDMRKLRMKHDARIRQLITMTPQSIEEDLVQFKDKFAFSSFDESAN